jgi:hypothetical protein
MIKKLLGGLAVVGLCAGAALYLSSCAQQAGPLNPDLGLLNASSTTAARELPTATITGPGSVSQTAVVQFSIPMNAATINTSNVVVYRQSTDGLSEALITYTVGYDAAGMRAIITPSGGVWPTDARYHIVVGVGCQSVTGNQLDGNGNSIPESAEFDNRHTLFSFGTPPVNVTYPGCVQATVNVNGGGLTAGGTMGGIAAAYSYVTVTVNLSLSGPGTTDPNFAYDSGSYFQDATTLHSNVRITNAGGAVLTPVSVAVSGTQNELLTIVLSLQPASKYYVTLKGGLNGIRTPLAAANMSIIKGLRFDGDYDNVAEASDDWKTATIMTANVDNSALPGFTVNAVTYDAGLRRVTVQFDIPVGIGTGTLNVSTVNNSSILLIDENDTDVGGDELDKPIIPMAIQLDNFDTTPGTPPSNPEVFIYIPEKFSQDSGDNHDHTVRVIVTPAVLTAEGLAMDNSGDGVLGMPDDTYSTTVTVENHQQ